MERLRTKFFWLLFWGLLAACGGEDRDKPLEPAAIYESAGVCRDVPAESAAGAREFQVYPWLDSIGPSGNALAVSESAVWIVESGSNTVRRFDKATGQSQAQFIDVGNERNPYGIFVDEASAEVLITNFAANTLSVASAETGEVLEEIADASLKNPSGVVATKDFIYVTNVHYLGTAQGYGPGSVTILDRKTREVLGNVPTTHKNPQYITLLDTVDGARIVISNGGAVRLGSGGVVAESDGSLELWEEGEDPLRPAVEIYPIEQLVEGSVGVPGRAEIASDGRSIYVMSGIAPGLLKLDLVEKRWVYGAERPLRLYEAEGDTTHSIAMGADDLLYITSFNQDALYVLDTSCDEILIGPVDLGTTGNMLEGPQSIALDFRSEAQGDFTDVYFLMSISNVLGKVAVSAKQ